MEKEDVKKFTDLMRSLNEFGKHDYDAFGGVDSDHPLISNSIALLKDDGVKLLGCTMVVDDTLVEITSYENEKEEAFQKDFLSDELVYLWFEREAKNLEEGIPIKVLTKLYGFEEYYC